MDILDILNKFLAGLGVIVVGMAIWVFIIVPLGQKIAGLFPDKFRESLSNVLAFLLGTFIVMTILGGIWAIGSGVLDLLIKYAR